MKSPTSEDKCAKGVFQIQSPICGVNFSNNISITQVSVNERRLYTLFLYLFPFLKVPSLTFVVQTITFQTKLPSHCF